MPRTTLLEKRRYQFEDFDKPVTCPAGTRIKERLEGAACHCRIEDSTITAAKDGTSLAILCMGDNTLCPTWRAAREIEWEHERVSSLIAPSGLRRNYTMEDVEEANARMAAGDFEGAQQIAQRIEESRREQGLRDVSKG